MNNKRLCSIKYNDTIYFRYFDVQALVGNISGYMGLCLGYSLLQIPELIVLIFHKLKGYCFWKIFEERSTFPVSTKKPFNKERQIVKKF